LSSIDQTGRIVGGVFGGVIGGVGVVGVMLIVTVIIISVRSKKVSLLDRPTISMCSRRPKAKPDGFQTCNVRRNQN